MPLPEPRKSTAPYFYKYSNANHLDWLRDIILEHELYLPNLLELNDDNDGLPRLAVMSEAQMATFLVDKFRAVHSDMSPDDLDKHELIIRYNVKHHGPAGLHPNLIKSLDEQCKDFRVYSMTKRNDMTNLWALYADGHRGYCLEFRNVGPMFEYAKDVSYLLADQMVVSLTDPDVLQGRFLFCKTSNWSNEDEVRLVLSRKDGRTKVRIDPAWLTKIILGREMSAENEAQIREWAKKRKPELTVAKASYDAVSRSIKIRDIQTPESKRSTPVATSPVPVFGVPEFAKTVHAAFPRLFEVLPRAQAALNDLTGPACEKPETAQRVIRNLSLLAGISMIELVTLAGNGLGQGALKIGRTMMETAVNADYLRQNPADLDDYLQWAWVEKNKSLNYVKTSLPHLLPQIPPEDINKVEDEFQKVRARFEKPNGDLRTSWCKLNLAERSTAVGMAALYRMLNPLSSSFIHGTIGGLTKHFDVAADMDRIAVPPSLVYCDQAMVAGHQLLLFVVETLSKTFGWEPVHSLASLVADFNYAWPQTAAEVPKKPGS